MAKVVEGKIVEENEGGRVAFDDVLDSIGQFGWAQFKVLLISSIFDIPMACAILFFLYGGYNPGFYCLSSQAVERNMSVNDIMLMEGQDANGTVTGLWAPDVCSINATSCSAIVFKPGYESIITEFSLVCDKKYVSTACTTSLMLGILFGAFISGHFSDIYGRKKVFTVLAFLMVASLYLQALSVNWIMFAIIRFMAGFAAGGTSCVSFIIPLEVIGPKWRTICGCLGLWQIGNLSFAGLGYLIREWRQLSLVAGGIATPGIIALFFLPESPRWLIQRNRVPEATIILQGMARLNKKPEPEPATINAIERHETSSLSVKDLFRNRKLTLNTITMFYLWFSCTMSYYGLSMNTRDIGGNIYMNNIILALTELAFYFSILYTGFRYGRKKLVVGYLSLAVLCLFTAICLGILNIQREIVAGITSLGRGSNSAAWAMAFLLCAEIYPTVIRSIAGGSCSTAGRIGGVLAPQIAYLTSVHISLPGIIFGVSIIVAMVLTYVILPETWRKPLPDILPPQIGCCSMATEEIPVQEEEKLTFQEF